MYGYLARENNGDIQIGITEKTSRGWGDVYDLPRMSSNSAKVFTKWLRQLVTDTPLGKHRLIEMFSQQTRHNIEWLYKDKK